MRKRLLLMMLLLLPMVVSRAKTEINGIYYNFDSSNKTAEVTSGSKKYSGSVTIPKSVTYSGADYSVTSIGNFAFSSSGLTSVTIPNTVTSIGNYAFSWSRGLTSVTIPSSVTSIGDNAFSDCSGLSSVIIPSSVTSIGDDAFYGCSGLTSVAIPNSVTSIGKYVFYGCSGLTSVTIPSSVTSIGNYAFARCSGLPSVSIPNSVSSIESNVFSGCSGLTSVTIPSSVTSIGDCVFSGCSCLTKITVGTGNQKYDSRDNCNAIIETASNTLVVGCKNTTFPSSVTSIGSYAFSSCSGLTSVTIPSSVTSIGSYAFSSCSGLTSVTIPSSVTSIESSTFSYCSSLTSVTVPSSVTSIGSSAFYGCSGLTSVTIPSSVTSIGEGVFGRCSELTSITVDTGNQNYDSRDNCNAIIETASNTLIAGCKNSTIPSSVVSIGDYAFCNCSGLTSITIPNSVTSIGSSAFDSCSGLTAVTIPNSVTIIGSFAFSSCSLTTLIIPSSVGIIGEEAFTCGISSNADVYCYMVPKYFSYKDAMDGINATLHVPASAINEFRETFPWSGFKTIVPIEDEDDLQSYLNSLEDTEDSFDGSTYRREFKNDDWQALYVPFEMNYSDWSAEFEVARVSGFRYDSGGLPTGLDGGILEATMVESGKVEANYPYLIRAKSKNGATLEVNVSGTVNKVVRTISFNPIPNNSNVSVKICGNYSNVQKLKSDRRARMRGGVLSIPNTDTEMLPPYRWYVSAPEIQAARMTIEIDGEDATVISTLSDSHNKPAVYDLQGRRMKDLQSLPSGVYIINNKKCVIK